MKHSYEKMQRLQMVTMAIALVLAIIALIQQAFSWMVLAMFYALACSFMFEALVELQKRNNYSFISQIVRAFLIAIFSTILFF
ncbi:hypothetical protein [Thalassobacillus pellis]|uniref:hypothetical protein n=1 Tax=Thalassobacillus pellis TaxID=748008 RepID=UPI0019605CB4|nr:hypothetical protein [Thalassobacillus pellis]MBM7551824.1 hypothetical protein [Thalassobacillus pellis]